MRVAHQSTSTHLDTYRGNHITIALAPNVNTNIHHGKSNLYNVYIYIYHIESKVISQGRHPHTRAVHIITAYRDERLEQLVVFPPFNHTAPVIYVKNLASEGGIYEQIHSYTHTRLASRVCMSNALKLLTLAGNHSSHTSTYT